MNNISKHGLHGDDLIRCQVKTPDHVVQFAWCLVNKLVPRPKEVLDLGAGDLRFARHGQFDKYVGVEIDDVTPSGDLPMNAVSRQADVLEFSRRNFDVVIGNPPYVKSNYIHPSWRDSCRRLLEAEGIEISGNGNLFLYFMGLALLRSNATGVVAQVVPYEWVSRPSASGLRAYIDRKGYSVDVYRFADSIFDRVLTTACVSVISKKSIRHEKWRYYEVDANLAITRLPAPSNDGQSVFIYRRRDANRVYCQRGLSPGGQSIFVLTESERVLHGLRRGADVLRCVTSLKHWNEEIKRLDDNSFETQFVSAGRPCWLINSATDSPNERVAKYLGSIGEHEWKKIWTCRNRNPWWRYRLPPKPYALVASGFRGRGPKVVRNLSGAVPLGGVHGIHVGRDRVPMSKVLDGMRNFDFRSRLVAHAKGLYKVEVNQMNEILQFICDEISRNDRQQSN